MKSIICYPKTIKCCGKFLKNKRNLTIHDKNPDSLVPTRGVMIPFFSGTGIITGITEKELESESHGIGSKVESIPGLESIPYVESAPVHKQEQPIIFLPLF